MQNWVQNNYIVLLTWIFITAVGIGFTHSCNKRKIDRLESIIVIEKESHEKELTIINTAHDKQLEAISEITKKYDDQIKKLTDQYDVNMKALEIRQKEIYKKYLDNETLMSEYLELHFNLRRLK